MIILKQLILLSILAITLPSLTLRAKTKTTCNTCKVLHKQFQKISEISQEELHKSVCSKIHDKEFEKAAINLLNLLPSNDKEQILSLVNNQTMENDIEDLKNSLESNEIEESNLKNFIEKYFKLIKTTMNKAESHFFMVAPIIATPLIIITSIYSFLAISAKLARLTGGIVPGTLLAILCSSCIMAFCDLVLFSDFVLFSCRIEAFIPLVIGFFSYKITKKLWKTA